MNSLLRVEWFKLKKSNMISIIFVGPLLALFIGLSMNNYEQFESNQWYITLLMMNLTYALLFLPLVTGILASFICRYEHQAGGWKQLLTLPVSRGKVFIAKYGLLLLVVLVIQLLYLLAVYCVGVIKGYTDPFPVHTFLKSILGGWVATFPLLALQLWMSILFKSFAAPFAVNVVFTLPAILIINSERIAPYYPWVQPFSMMYITDDTNDLFFIPWDQLSLVLGGSFLLFFFCGYMYFQRKSI